MDIKLFVQVMLSKASGEGVVGCVVVAAAAGESNGICSRQLGFRTRAYLFSFSFKSSHPNYLQSFFPFSFQHIMSSIKEQKAHQTLDQSSMPNFNSSWVNYKGKRVFVPMGTWQLDRWWCQWLTCGSGLFILSFYQGAWSTTIFVIVLLKTLYSIIPFISPEASWTLTNLTFNIVSTSSLYLCVYVQGWMCVCVCVDVCTDTSSWGRIWRGSCTKEQKSCMIY